MLAILFVGQIPTIFVLSLVQELLRDLVLLSQVSVQTSFPFYT